jgi:acyl-coenzyme A thioesterase PaaI-like protein
MKLKSTLARFLINLYPPMIFNGVRVIHVAEDYTALKLRIRKTFLTRNHSGSIFGGSLFSAVDPFYALMFWQIFQQEEIDCSTWLKSAEIKYLRPANKKLYASLFISEEEKKDALLTIKKQGRFDAHFTIYLVDKEGLKYVEIKQLITLKNRK